jgi:hypothetical protein
MTNAKVSLSALATVLVGLLAASCSSRALTDDASRAVADAPESGGSNDATDQSAADSHEARNEAGNDAPSSSRDAGDVSAQDGGVTCGDKTCSPNEYCLVRYSEGGSGTNPYQCVDIATDCAGGAFSCTDCARAHQCAGTCDSVRQTAICPPLI